MDEPPSVALNLSFPRKEHHCGLQRMDLLVVDWEITCSVTQSETRRLEMGECRKDLIAFDSYAGSMRIMVAGALPGGWDVV